MVRDILAVNKSCSNSIIPSKIGTNQMKRNRLELLEIVEDHMFRFIRYIRYISGSDHFKRVFGERKVAR